MRKNESESRRGPRTPSTGARSSGAGKRDGKPRSGSSFGTGAGARPGARRSTRSSFGERAEGSSEAFERKPRTDREDGSAEPRRSSDWSTGGYRVTKRGTGKSTGFKGYKKDADQGPRGQRRDGGQDFKGPRKDDNQGFRGPRRDDGQGFRGPRRDDSDGFRGPRRDDSQGFRGPRRDAEPKAAFGDSKLGVEKRAPRTPVNRKNDVQRKDDVVIKRALNEIETGESQDREDRVEGRNSVFEALRSGRPLNKLFIDKDHEDPMLSRIVAMAREKNVPVQYLERFKLDTMSQTRTHQGVILEVAAQEYVEVEDILAKAAEKGEKPFVIILDGITDTNNLGSIIRSAECAGVHGIILPKRRSATLNATVAKVAAGALEYVPVARVTNLVQTLRELKEEGLWIVGADMDGQSSYYDADLSGPCALVIGSEGEGLARLVKDECDLMVKIPMKGKISSLNAGVAAALIMFEISKKRG